MKPKHLALPLITLVIAGILLGSQRKRVSEIRGEIGKLHERIAEARVVAAPSISARPWRPDPRLKPIDWEKLAGLIGENPHSQPPEMLSMQRQLLAMDRTELLAALDHIAAMDLGEEMRIRLELMILDPLCKKDPEAALERFKGRLREHAGMHMYFLSNALKDWAKKDLTAATAWLDREIEAGTLDPRSLDGKDGIRARFESAVVFSMFALDPAKAEARLSSLPASMRAEILGQPDGFHKMWQADEIALAEIIRRQLDEKGRVDAIAARAERVIGGGGDLAAVDEYLNSVYAAPDERERSAESAAFRHGATLAIRGELSVPKLDAMRAWVVRDAPGSVDRLTGDLLGMAANMSTNMDFGQASALALRYHQAAGNDEVLHAFLNKLSDKGNKEEARRLAENISDPNKRANALKRFQ